MTLPHWIEINQNTLSSSKGSANTECGTLARFDGNHTLGEHMILSKKVSNVSKSKRYAEGEVRTHEAYAVDCLKFALKATPFDRSGTAANENAAYSSILSTN